MDKKTARTFIRYIINNPNKAIEELEYLAYSNEPKIDEMPKLSDYGLSEEILKNNQLFKKNREFKKKKILKYSFISMCLIFPLWYLWECFCSVDEVFNLWLFILTIICSPLIMLFFWLFVYIYICDKYEYDTEVDKKYKEYEYALNKYKYQQNFKKHQYWENMSGREFEIAVAQYFKNQGYDVELTQCSNDGGIDIVLYSNNTKIYVQCKHYKNYVGIAPARELYGVMRADNVSCGYLVTMNGFTKGVYQFVNDKNIHLLTIDDLIQ